MTSKTFVPKQPAEFRSGDIFTLDKASWIVTEYAVSATEANYKERQWTVRNARTHASAYVLLSDEEVDGRRESKWILSRPIPLGEVRQSVGASLEKGVPFSPPPELSYNGETFQFSETYRMRARDDEGNMVPRDTWDYYDRTGIRNLSIEIWHEEDADYPESYLGVFFHPSEIIHTGKSVVAPKIPLQPILIGGGVVSFFMLCAGTACDWILCLVAPLVILLVTAATCGVPSLLLVLASSAATAVLVFVLLSWLNGWVIGACVILLASIAVRGGVSLKSDVVFNCPVLASAAAFMAAWVYSFFVYFRFAPGPHNSGQFMATLILPIIIAALTFLLNWGLDQTCSNNTSNA